MKLLLAGGARGKGIFYSVLHVSVHLPLLEHHQGPAWTSAAYDCNKTSSWKTLYNCINFGVPYGGVGCCLGPGGNGVSSGVGGKGGPGPPGKELDKQSNSSKEGGNMEQEEEGKKSQAWRRGPSMHRVSIIKRSWSMYLNVSRLSMMLRLMSYLFQDNKSYGVKTHLHSSSNACHCTSQVTSGTFGMGLLDNSNTCLNVFVYLSWGHRVSPNREIRKVKIFLKFPHNCQ